MLKPQRIDLTLWFSPFFVVCNYILVGKKSVFFLTPTLNWSFSSKNKKNFEVGFKNVTNLYEKITNKVKLVKTRFSFILKTHEICRNLWIDVLYIPSDNDSVKPKEIILWDWFFGNKKAILKAHND